MAQIFVLSEIGFWSELKKGSFGMPKGQIIDREKNHRSVKYQQYFLRKILISLVDYP